MNRRDLDRAFAKTPDIIRESILEGIAKGEKAMKFRHKLIALTSVAAALIAVLTVTLAAGGLHTPAPDIVAARQPAPRETAQPRDDIVYCTEKGNYFHGIPDCSGMENARSLRLQDALAKGKEPCPVCLEGESVTAHSTLTPMPTAFVTPEPTLTPMPATDGAVYYTPGGSFYHSDEHCSGMEGASARSVEQAIAAGKLHCPYCVDEDVYILPLPIGADDQVYINSRSSSYHLDPECGNVLMPSRVSLEEAEFLNKTACGDCALSVAVDEGIIAELTGMSLQEAFPDYELIGVYSSPVRTGSAEQAPAAEWEFKRGNDVVAIYLSGPNRYQNGRLDLNFSGDPIAREFIEKVDEPMRGLFTESGPKLIGEINRLAAAESGELYASSVCFNYNEAGLTGCELTADSSSGYVNLCWQLNADGPQLVQILWDNYNRG